MNKNTVAKILLGLVVFALVGSSILKFVGAEEMGAGLGNPQAPYILGVIELLIALAVLLPKTRMLGFILAASYFGGAIAVAWLVEKEFPTAGIIVNTIVYAAAYFTRPSLAHGEPTVMVEPDPIR